MTAPQTTTPADTTTPPAGTTTAPDGTTTEGGGAAPATDPPATDGTTPSDDPATWDPERAKRTIENQRRVEAEQKRVIADQKAKLDEIERAKLSETDRLKADKEAAEAAVAAAREDALAARFEAAAVAAGIPPERIAAARAVAGEVATTDESGTMSIDTTVFERLKAEHEYLFGSQAAPQPHVSFGSAASQGPGGKQGVTLTPDQIAMAQKAGMSLDDFAKHAARTKR